jgi:serine/threonine protein phosphatase PrpC
MHLFGVADGHGQFGHEVSEYATTMLGLIVKVKMIEAGKASFA